MGGRGNDTANDGIIPRLNAVNVDGGFRAGMDGSRKGAAPGGAISFSPGRNGFTVEKPDMVETC